LHDRRASVAASAGTVGSLMLDPHTWLSAPVESGCALVRDGTLLYETFLTRTTLDGRFSLRAHGALHHGGG
jgi:glutamate/tyrosine decarboxylase-like PLP-dependent enzyme